MNENLSDEQQAALAEAREQAAVEERESKGAEIIPHPSAAEHDGSLAVTANQDFWNARQLAALMTVGLENVPKPHLAAFLHIVQKSGLDPFSREIYYIGRDDKKAPGGVRYTAQTGIDGYRRIAERTGEYAGREGPWWCGKDGVWREVWLDDEPPKAARVAIWRKGIDKPFIATAVYREFVPMYAKWEGPKGNRRKVGEEPGAMWQKMPAHMLAKCLPGNTRIQTDQGSLTIRQIVRARLALKVRSVDVATGRECWQPVTGWFDNGLTDEWVTIRTVNGSHGNRHLRATPDHPFLTPTGWVDAGDLVAGDRVAITSPTLTDEQDQVIRGGLLGDGTLSGRPRPSTVPHYAEAHSTAQADYLRWKAAALANLQPKVKEGTRTDGAGGTHPVISMRTVAAPVLYHYRGQPKAWLDGLGDLGLAVWFMDDGSVKATGGKSGSVSACLHTCGFGAAFADLAADWFTARGIPAKVLRREKNPYLAFGVEATRTLLTVLAPYLHAEGTKKVWHADPIPQGLDAGYTFLPVLETKTVTKRERRFDIEVGGTHTFVVNNVVVHNCAEALAIRQAFPAEAGGIFTEDEMGVADQRAEAEAEERRAEQRRELVQRPWGPGEAASPADTADGEVVTGEVVDALDRDALEAELAEQARVLGKSVPQHATRWAAAHKKNITEATDSELYEFLVSHRARVDAKRAEEVADAVTEVAQTTVIPEGEQDELPTADVSEGELPHPYQDWDGKCIVCTKPREDTLHST